MKNELIIFIENNMKNGKIMFNIDPRNTIPQRCPSFKFIPIDNYDIMIKDAITYFRNKGFLVTENKTICEIIILY